MEQRNFRSTGISLILGGLLIIVTMVLHPSGGDFERIIRISKTITMAHSLAILSLPVLLFGFYGLTLRLMDKWKLSILAFMIIAFGFVAAMFAALYNGLALPYFLNQYSESLQDNMRVLGPMAKFSFAINISLDYIFIVACCLAIFVYSLIILLENKAAKWIGYLGVFITFLSILGGLSDFVFTSLMGFRMFTFCMAVWILSNGFCLLRFDFQK